MSATSPSLRPSLNRQFVFAVRPTGMPDQSTFKLVESPIRELNDGELLVRAMYLSVDPYMRGRLSQGRSYAAGVELGAVMVGAAVARVVESKNPAFAVNDIVNTYSGWQEYAISDGQGLRKLDPSIPVSTALGVLGVTGLSAYFGLLDVCDPKPGETVVVSGAAGAVGSVVGQIAKIKGCRTVGIAGGDDKVDWIKRECGFDAAFNYKTTADYSAALRELCPKGIDVYFDNVGGPITDAVLQQLNVGARISICGQISQYNNAKPEMGPRLLTTLIVARAKMQGFLITDYAARFGPALAVLTNWYREGKINSREDIVEGFENLPQAFIGMLKGENIGKRLVKVA
ncbi:MAG TPA: NADP-dependent oxidoreductase [Bryobacteraceae bacterium]|nr:NADP-dependent oxidoreductase [Bryobacteraceae bacterium]